MAETESKGNLVSVIMPTHGGRRTLPRAIDSALRQEGVEVQVVVVDDNNPGTAERTATEIMMSRYSNDSRVLYLQHERNKNAAAARNTALRHANGSFINFLDDDDWFLPGKLSQQIAQLKSSDAGAVYCGWRNASGDHRQTIEGRPVRELLLMEYQPIGPTLLFRSETIANIGGWDESFRRHQDYELMIRYFAKYSIKSYGEVLIELGTNDGENVLHGTDLEELKSKFLKQFDEIIAQLDSEYPGTRRQIVAKHFAAVFIDHLYRRKFVLAARLAGRMLPKYPISFVRATFEYGSRRVVLKILRKRGSRRRRS